MLQLSDLTGLWRRSLIAWPDGRRDSTSKVQWLQGVGAFGDLRQSVPWPDFSHVKDLTDLSLHDCETLAAQQAFAGYLTVAGNYFEWTRLIDFQPRHSLPRALASRCSKIDAADGGTRGSGAAIDGRNGLVCQEL